MVEPNGWTQAVIVGGMTTISVVIANWVNRKNFREKLVTDVKTEDKLYGLDVFKAIQAEAGEMRDELRLRISYLESEISELRKEVEESRSERELLHGEYIRLHKEHDLLLIEHTQLRVEHQQLLTDHNVLQRHFEEKK